MTSKSKAKPRKILGGLAIQVRWLAAKGWGVVGISNHFDLDPRDVRRVLAKPPRRPAQGRARVIHGRLGPKVAELAGQGLDAAAIADLLDLDPARVGDYVRRLHSRAGARLSRPRSQAKQAAIDDPAPRRRRLARTPRESRPPKLDEWKTAALSDPRYRDPTGPPPAAAPAPAAGESTGPGQAAVGPGPGPGRPVAAAVPLGPPPPVAESWGSMTAGGPRKMTPAALEEALRLRQAGWSWPDVARKMGCHRMTVYHALRR